MEKIKFDSGMRSFQLGEGGVLRFNPADPNLYARFMACEEKLQAIEEDLTAQAREGKGITLLAEADRKLKDMLSWVFGPQNDFEKLLGGVSLLATGQNGERVIVNLLSALQPIMEKGARACAREEVEKAQKKAQSRREEQA